MRKGTPTLQEIDELLAFVPQLTAEGFSPIQEWGGSEKLPGGAITFPWPEYEGVVREFFEVAGQDCWMDFDYVPQEAGRMLEDRARVRQENLPEIKRCSRTASRRPASRTAVWPPCSASCSSCTDSTAGSSMQLRSRTRRARSYFESSPSAVRRFFMTWSAAPICVSNSGSYGVRR